MSEQPSVAGRPWQEFLAGRPLGVLATNGSDGTPHAVPVEVVVRDGLVYAWAERASAKVRNVGRDGKAALVSYKGNDGVLIRGSARLIASGEPGYAEVTKTFLDKYEREESYGNDVLVEITPARITVFS